MINVNNIQRYDDIPFEEYLKVPGYSHSFLKAERSGFTPEFIETDKVRIGKLVDGILTDPTHVDMNHPLYATAKSISLSIINSQIGPFMKMFKTQLSYTADLEYNGIVMPAKFRPDWLLPGHAVLDLKVTQVKDMNANIQYMGYDNQTWGYARVAQVPHRYIVAQYCKAQKDGSVIPVGPAKIIKLLPLEMHNDFWADKILKFGRVIA